MGATIKVAPIHEAGELILDSLAQLRTHRTMLVALTHLANSLGTVNPVEQLIGVAHSYGVPVLLDGVQSTPHMPLRFLRLLRSQDFRTDCHRCPRPQGRTPGEMPPWQDGGKMIQDVTMTKTMYQAFHKKFKAGTPGHRGRCPSQRGDQLSGRSRMPTIAAYEHELLEYASQALASVHGLRPIGTATQKTSVLSFVLNGLRMSTSAAI